MFSWYNAPNEITQKKHILPLHAPAATDTDSKGPSTSRVRFEDSSKEPPRLPPSSKTHAGEPDESGRSRTLPPIVPTKDDADVAKIHSELRAIKEAALPPHMRPLVEDRGENLKTYDPFTGEQRSGPPPRAASVEREQSVGPEDSISDAETHEKSAQLWEHLDRIRDLQSEISSLHMQMEGVGFHNRPYHRRNRSNVDIGIGEDESPKVDFQRLAGKFEGREQEIDNIMAKLDSLSDTMLEFHRLQMPTFNFTPAPKNKPAPTSSIPTPPVKSTSIRPAPLTTPFPQQVSAAADGTQPATLSPPSIILTNASVQGFTASPVSTENELPPSK